MKEPWILFEVANVYFDSMHCIPRVVKAVLAAFSLTLRIRTGKEVKELCRWQRRQ
jgi:hypothetical protein